MTDQALATPSEVAEFLRTTEAKLANDRYQGIGPRFVRYQRKILYRWEDVHAFVEANILQRTDDRPAPVTPTAGMPRRRD